MTEHQWQMVVRTFWLMVVLAVVTVGTWMWVDNQNDANRRAHETVCEIYYESGLHDPDC